MNSTQICLQAQTSTSTSISWWSGYYYTLSFPYLLSPNHCSKPLEATWYLKMAVVSWAKKKNHSFHCSTATYKAIFLFLNQPVAYFSFLFNFNFIFLSVFPVRDNYKFCKVKGLTDFHTFLGIWIFILMQLLIKKKKNSLLSFLWTSILQKIIWSFRADLGLQESRT